MRTMGSKKEGGRTLAVVETLCQFPEAMSMVPSPIRLRMSCGVSWAPVANGV